MRRDPVRLRPKWVCFKILRVSLIANSFTLNTLFCAPCEPTSIPPALEWTYPLETTIFGLASE